MKKAVGDRDDELFSVATEERMKNLLCSTEDYRALQGKSERVISL